MLRLTPAERLRRLLVIGAHPDDIEIGCGGTILRLLEECPGLEVHWVVLCGEGGRGGEARASAATILAGAAGLTIELAPFKDGFLPYVGASVKEHFEALKARCDPQLVLTHRREDAHQDHRLVNELTWNTFRDHLILEYEIPKYDGDMGQPNLYVELSTQQVDTKTEVTLRHFASQVHRDWFEENLFKSLMRLRGMEARSPSGFAEGFYCHKAVL